MWYLINSWKLLSENAQFPTPLENSTPLLKFKCKSSSLLANITHFSAPPRSPPPCRKGGRILWTSFSFTCGIVFNYRFTFDILSEENISTLWSFEGMYILPSPVFFKGAIPPVGVWEILGSGNLTKKDSDHLNILES